MENLSLLDEIVKSEGIDFRGIGLGASTDAVVEAEGASFEEKQGSRPHYKYSIEVGEMEEIVIYYNFADGVVDEITLHFMSYPDHYWKKAHGELSVEFDQRLQANELQDYSRAYLATLDDVVKHFTNVFQHEPTIERRDGVFSAPPNNFAVYSWAHEEQVRLSVMTYVDDKIWNNVKNTMKIYLRRY